MKAKQKMKTSNFKFGVMLMAASLVMGTVSCKKGCTDPTAVNYDSNAKKDDGSCIAESSENIVKSGFITANETWTADNVYELAGKVVVSDGVTLTIEAGTIIKGREGSGTLASALVVARGGKIMAEGTAANPIVFTSVLDNIAVGQQQGSNLDETDQGKWGGVLILGKAPVSAADGDTEAQIEGIPVTDAFGAYGGSDAADNSGVFTYVSIRHAGVSIGAGNEINGLTLGGVGTGTTLSNIEVVANFDDGIEFFGGTVNATNLVVSFQKDDGIDLDMNYSGTIENFIVVNGSTSDKALEIDGPEGSTHVDGLFTLNNGSTYIYGGADATSDYKSKAQGTINNVKMGTVKIRTSYQNNCVDPKTDAYTYLTQSSPKLIFQNTEFVGDPVVYTKSEDDSEVLCDVDANEQTTANGAMTTATAAGGDQSVFSWTWTAVNNKF